MARHRLDNLWLTVASGLAAFVGLAVWPLLTASSPDCAPEEVLRVAGGRDVSTDHQRRAIISGWRGGDGGSGPRLAELMELPGVADQQRSQLLAWARAEGCPAADVYILDLQWIPEFARGGYIEPLSSDEVNMDDVLPNLREAVEYDGRVWAMPFNADAALLYYRTDLGITPPRTWNEVWEQSRRLPADPGNGLSSGYAPQFAEYEGMTVNALELIWASGGDLIDGRRRVTVDRPPVRRLLRTLTGLIGDRRPVIDRAALDHFEADSIEAFAKERVAFMRSWPYAYAALANNDRMRNADGSLKFAVTALPGRSVLGGQVLAIDARSPNREQALSLISHLVDVPQQQQLFSCGGFAPVLRQVYRNPGRCKATTSDKDVVHRLPDDQVDTLRHAVENARARPPWPYYTEVSRVLSHELRNCLDNRDVCGDEASIAAFTHDLDRRLTIAMRGR